MRVTATSLVIASRPAAGRHSSTIATTDTRPDLRNAIATTRSFPRPDPTGPQFTNTIVAAPTYVASSFLGLVIAPSRYSVPLMSLQPGSAQAATSRLPSGFPLDAHLSRLLTDMSTFTSPDVGKATMVMDEAPLAMKVTLPSFVRIPGVLLAMRTSDVQPARLTASTWIVYPLTSISSPSDSARSWTSAPRDAPSAPPVLEDTEIWKASRIRGSRAWPRGGLKVTANRCPWESASSRVTPMSFANASGATTGEPRSTATARD